MRQVKLILSALTMALFVEAPAWAKDIELHGVTAASADPFMISAQCGAQDAANALGVKLVWNGIGSFDVNQLLDALNVTIQQKPDGVLLLPISPTAFVAPVKQLMEGGVPVVTIGPPLAQPVEYHNVNSNNQHGGELLADHIGPLLGDKSAVAVIGLAPGNNPESPRDTAFIARLNAKFPEIRTLPEEFVMANSAKAADVTTALVNANPDLKAIFGTDGPTTVGIVSGIKASGRTDVRVFGYDSTPVVLNAMTHGKVSAIVAASPYNMGKAAVEKAVGYLRSGATGPVIASNPNMTTTDVSLLTPENVGSPEAKSFLLRTSCE